MNKLIEVVCGTCGPLLGCNYYRCQSCDEVYCAAHIKDHEENCEGENSDTL